MSWHRCLRPLCRLLPQAAVKAVPSPRPRRRPRPARPRIEELESRLVPALSWNSTGLSLFGDEIGVNVTPDGQFFASDGFDIHRSQDQGATWKTVTGFATFAGGAIAYPASNPTTLIAGRSHGTVKSVEPKGRE